MADVHFTTTTCEPNKAFVAQRKPNFYNICFCIKDIVQPRFEDFITFLYVFMSVVQVLFRYKLWVNVPVARAIFFPTEDCTTSVAFVVPKTLCFNHIIS